ncbi:unnamed protein product [Musa banksii]
MRERKEGKRDPACPKDLLRQYPLALAIIPALCCSTSWEPVLAAWAAQFPTVVVLRILPREIKLMTWTPLQMDLGSRPRQRGGPGGHHRAKGEEVRSTERAHVTLLWHQCMKE